jgi:hypothetical protein
MGGVMGVAVRGGRAAVCGALRSNGGVRCGSAAVCGALRSNGGVRCGGA